VLEVGVKVNPPSVYIPSGALFAPESPENVMAALEGKTLAENIRGLNRAV